MVSVAMGLEVSPPVEVVDESVAVVEMGGLELEVTKVELEAAVVVDVAVVDGGLGPGVAGGTMGNVVFRAGHPKDPVSRRTGQAISRESMPFQTTAG